MWRSLSLLGLAACGGEGVGGPCDCLLDGGGVSMTDTEVAALPALAATCFGTDPVELEANAACLPVTVGSDAATGMDIVASYFCSDVCPDAGGILFTYDAIGEPDCCAAGGIPRYDAAWGGYLGCEPEALSQTATCVTFP